MRDITVQAVSRGYGDAIIATIPPVQRRFSIRAADRENVFLSRESISRRAAVNLGRAAPFSCGGSIRGRGDCTLHKLLDCTRTTD